MALVTKSRASRNSALTILVSSRNFSQCPPLKALRPTRCLPAGDFGTVDLVHGCNVRINSACRALRSNVQPLAMINLQ